MELTISKEKFKRFLKLVSLMGDNEVKEALFDVKADSISTLVKCPTNNVGLWGVMKGKYTELGEIGIDDLTLLESSLNIQPKDEVTLKHNQNKFVISSGKTKASLLIRKSDYIKNKPKEEDFKKYISAVSGGEFSLKIEDVERIIDSYNLIKSENILLSCTNGGVKFTFNKLDNEIETEIELKNKIEPFQVKATPFLIYLLALINDEVVISIKKDIPVVLVSYKKDDIDFKYIISQVAK